MDVVLRIALRNLREHKAKTLIIGVLISLGIFVLMTGNSLLDTANAEVEKAFITSYTGHIMVAATSDVPMSIVGSPGGGMGNQKVKVVPHFQDLYDYLNNHKDIAAINPQVGGLTFIRFDEVENAMALSLLLGVEPENYQKMFPDNIEILKGRFLEPGETGILLAEHIATEISKELNITIKPGDELKLTQMGGFGTTIRRTEVRGIFKFKTENTSLRNYSIIDAQTLRSLTGLIVGTTEDIAVEDDEISLLESSEGDMFEDDLFADDMFGDDLFSEDIDDSFEDIDGIVEDDFFDILGDTSERDALIKPDSGAWHYILIRLNEGVDLKTMIVVLNGYFKKNNIPAVATDWVMASGGTASISKGFQFIFNIIVIIIAIVAIIIIMNTLLVSIMERTSEIGTMRALGGQKSFIRKIFITETMSISLIFGTIGLALSLIVLGIFSAVGLDTSGDFFQLIFGTNTIRPVISAGSIVIAYIIMIGIGILSSLYPVSTALKIEPIKAIQSE